MKILVFMGHTKTTGLKTRFSGLLTPRKTNKNATANVSAYFVSNAQLFMCLHIIIVEMRNTNSIINTYFPRQRNLSRSLGKTIPYGRRHYNAICKMLCRSPIVISTH